MWHDAFELFVKEITKDFSFTKRTSENKNESRRN